MPKDDRINRRGFFKRLAGLGAVLLGFALFRFGRGTEAEANAGEPHRRADHWRRLAG